MTPPTLAQIPDQKTTPNVESMTMSLSTDAGKELTFTTRFGEVKLREDRLIEFPQGLFGFRECVSFGLTKLPNVDESPIMLLQCVNEPAIAFLVADPKALGLDIKASDRAAAIEEAQLSDSDTQLLAILTLYDNGDSYYLTANLRAPLLIDSLSRTGTQHILASKDYTTQHKI